jgi:hypothetical protein
MGIGTESAAKLDQKQRGGTERIGCMPRYISSITTHSDRGDLVSHEPTVIRRTESVCSVLHNRCCDLRSLRCGRLPRSTDGSHRLRGNTESHR